MVASRSNPAAALRDLPELDVKASDALATTILGKRSWGRARRSHRTGDLSIDVYPKDGEIAVAVYGDLVIVAGEDLLSWFEQVPDAWGETLIAGYDVDVYVLHSVVSMGCFATWRGGELTRSFAGSSDDGVIVDEGERLPFETGLEGAGDDGDGDEHDFGWITENAILDRLGYCYEGPYSPDNLDPATVPLLVYR
ncbi:hypothetical protein AXK61_07435 [Tsukamurella pseudospumae]|uniref:Uncharacterized protein n=2 Tax=Tsukamurella pseudospumae TaxID=239498 RepID=A0A137YXP4_9ACTN|nr:hypothetical protein AXK61_07435 [Tsukamurella pseudospumae]